MSNIFPLIHKPLSSTQATKNAVCFSSELVSNIVDDGASTTVTSSRSYQIDRQLADPKSNGSQKLRRSRYLRQTYRPRRRPPFDMRMRNIRRPMYPMYPNRNHIKPPRPYPPPKSRYRYQENWRHKWPEQNQPFGPYSAMDEEEEEAEPYDEYDEMEEAKHDEPWLSKKYRETYDDVMPVSSKYSEKRSPVRFLHAMEMMRSKRPYDLYESLRKDSQVSWQERRLKNYRELLDLLNTKKMLESYDDFPANRIENHRFKMANLARLKSLEEDYDFSAANAMKLKRFKSDPLVHQDKPSDESRYEQEVQNVAKYVAAHHSPFPPKLELPQEVVYSAKYRGQNTAEGKEGTNKPDVEKLKSDHSTPHIEDMSDWKRDQQPIYQAYMPEKSNFDKSETSIVRSQTYKPEQLLPNDLIAYMSANPTEQVVGKEERYLEPSYPYDLLKAVFPSRKISPVIDHDLEITFDERLSDWKH